MLDREWDAVVKRWIALGQWIARLEESDQVGVVPCRLGHRIHDPVWRHHQSQAMLAYWARRKAMRREA
jgi:hypothetical protein